MDSSKKQKLCQSSDESVEELHATSSSSDIGEEKSQKNSLAEFDTIPSDDVHDYLNTIFKFRNLENNEWKLPLFSDSTFEKPQIFLSHQKKPELETKGKTYLQLLYEFVQKNFDRGTKIFFRKILEIKGLTDFCAEVEIDGTKYGIAVGDTFKSAKHNASEVTLRILRPSLFTNSESDKSVFQVKIYYIFQPLSEP